MATPNNKDKNEDKGKEGSIDRLEEELYSRSSTGSSRSRHEINLKPEGYKVSESWDDSSESVESTDPEADDQYGEEMAGSGKMSFAHKVLFVSLAFFVLAVGTGVYLFFFGPGAFSTSNVEIEISGPDSVDGGEEFVLDIAVVNNNALALENANITIEYPQGTRDPEDLSRTLSRQSQNLGNVSPDSEESFRVRAVMFGEVDDVRPVRVEIGYDVAGSTSRFTQEKIYEITIRSAPVVLSLSYPRETNPVQDVELSLNIRSNTNKVLRDVMVRADYPFGFDFSESEPGTLDGEEGLWFVGDLEPGEEKDLVIRGRIQGQVHDDKTFSFSAGQRDPNGQLTTDINFISLTESIRITEPFMDLQLTLGGGSDPDYITRAGNRVSGTVSWNNNTGENVNDLKIEIDLDGEIFDRTSVGARQGGFFRSVDNKIIWDQNVLSDLSSISPGEGGSVNFNFDILSTDDLGLEEIKENLDMFVIADISGVKISDSAPSEDMSSFAQKRVMLSTNARLNSRIVYSTGPLQNTGPIPPRAEEETTYTVIWNTSSTLNDAEGVEVRATLPIYVEWVDSIYPESEDVTYNPADRSVTWDAGEIQAGSGVRTSPKEVAFQVSFLPSLAQLNSTPVIIREPVMTGVDTFTGVSLEDRRPNLTTRTSTDPNHSSINDARVVE